MTDDQNPADAAGRQTASEAPRKTPASRWQRTRFFLRALEVRLRFIGLFVLIGLLMTNWATIEQYWDRWTRPSVAAAADAADTEYYCPMHPNVIRPGLEPNGAVPSCPICGMPLSKRKKGDTPALPAGVLSRVQLSPERVQLAGVETARASYMPLTREIRAVGYIEYDESRQSEIVSRVAGYLEVLHVDKTYQQVDQGQPLAEIYSPALYSGVQELLLAKKHGADDLVASARRRLKLQGVDDAEIDEALQSTDAAARLLIRSPQSGRVIEKNVVQGASVEPGAVLFKVADVSTVWIEADVFERDIAFMRSGQRVAATVEAIPGKEFAGEIAVIYPELNPETRTNRVRIAVDNPEMLLRPGMFATVRVQTPIAEIEPFKTLAQSRQKPEGADDHALIAFQKICPVTGKELGSMGDPLKVAVEGQTVFICCAGCETPLLEKAEEYLARLAPPPASEVLTVPEQAVIDTGAQKVVYVEREPGLFEGVAVELGPRAGGYYPVISGLTVGDRIAAAGAFLLDAETRLNPGAASTYFGASGSSGGGQDAAPLSSAPAASASASDEQPMLSAAELQQIDKLPPEDRALAIAQAVCPVTGEPLGSMGPPVKIMLEGEAVFLCCQGCETDARADAKATVEKVKALRAKAQAAPAGGAKASGAPVHQH